MKILFLEFHHLHLEKYGYKIRDEFTNEILKQKKKGMTL